MWMQAGDVGRGVAVETRCRGEGSKFKCSGKESVAQRKMSPGGEAEVESEKRVPLMEYGLDAGGGELFPHSMRSGSPTAGGLGPPRGRSESHTVGGLGQGADRGVL